MKRHFKLASRSTGISVLFLALALIAAGIYFARPAYNEIKRLRAHSLVEGMSDYYLVGDWQTYELRLMTALKLAPHDEKVMQAQARYLAVRKHSLAMELWRQLVLQYPLNPDNWEGLFLTALQFNDKKMATLGLEGFRRAAPDRPVKIRQHEIKWLAMVGRIEEAVNKALPLFLPNVDIDRGFLFQAAALILERGNEADHIPVTDWLQEVVEEGTDSSLNALSILARNPYLKPEAALLIAQQLESFPEASLSHQLLAATLKVRFSPPSDVSMFWYELSAGKELSDRIEIARWLQNQGDFLSSTMIIQPSDALQHRDAALVHVRNLKAGQAWEELRRFVRDRDCPLPPPLKQLYLARTAAEMDAPATFTAEWRRAMQLARGNATALGYLANMAEQQGWDEQAEEACRELTVTPQAGLRGWLGLYNLGLKRGNEALVNEALEALQPQQS